MYAGKPLIAHSIEHALMARRVARTIVSTEDEEIAGVARAHGAEVFERPSALAADDATSESALLHVLDILEQEGDQPDLIVFLQCTSPARAQDDIDRAVGVLLDSEADSLLSACRFERYVWRMVDGTAQPINYDYRHRWRDQEFPPQFLENGSIYVTRRAILRETGNRLGGRIVVYEMPAERSFQIDYPEDTRMLIR